MIAAGTMSFVVVATSAFGYGYYEKLNGNVHRVHVFGYTAEKKRPAKAKDGAENILLVGSDSRVGATAAQLKEELTTEDGGSNNTDTIILMHISPENVVTMVSFPRDSWVDIPGHSPFKINAAYADGEADHKGGGPALLTETVENLTGVHIDHYVQVNLYQFIEISNAVGGVQVCLTAPAKDSFSGIDLPAGVSTIKGSQALAFVRQRHGLAAGDLDRIKRQQRFISAVVKKVKTIRNPLTLNALLEKATSSLTVDDGLSGRALISLANRLKDVDTSAIHFPSLPLLSNPPRKYSSNGQSISYIALDLTALPAFFANITNEQTASATPSTSTTTVTPASVSVEVLNGRGTSGAAAAAKATLAGYGFNVVSVGDAARTSTTKIRYSTAQQSAAAELAKAVPGATLVKDDSLGSTVMLTLGTDRLPLTNPGTTTTTTTTTATPSTSPTTPPVTAANLDCGP